MYSNPVGIRGNGREGPCQLALAPMRETRPQVFLIARPALDLDGLRGYLEAVGGASWLDRRAGANPAQTLVEFAGRACYRSWEPGLNPNVTRVREDQGEYLDNVLASGHGSVLEHASYTFAFRDVSRVFTHELVRHRAGSAFSQESLRYVRLDEIGFRVPPALESRARSRDRHRRTARGAAGRRGRASWASTTTASPSPSRRRRRPPCAASRPSA